MADNETPATSWRWWLGLAFLGLYLAGVAISCGGEDLTFPGNIPPPTAVPEPTETPDNGG